MNINDEKGLRPSPKTHPINTNTRPRQLSPFNDQLADFREPPPPLSGRNSLTDHKKKLLTFPYHSCCRGHKVVEGVHGRVCIFMGAKGA